MTSHPQKQKAPPESGDRQERYLRLFEALSPLIGSHRIEEICPASCELAANLLEVEACSLFLYDEEQDALALAGATHIPRSEWESVALPTNAGICGQVFTLGRPILLRSPQDFEKYGMEHRSRYGQASCVTAPLMVHGEVGGVINVANPKDGRIFEEQDLRLIESAALVISGGIGNARRFRETARVHRRLEEILENLHIGLVELDANLRITHANGRFCEMLGGSSEAFLNLPLKEALDPSLAGVCRRLIHATLRESAICQDRVRGRMGGGERDLVVTVSRVRTAGRLSDNCLLMFEDVSGEEEVERLRQADSIKGAFLRMISHELRTPLTIIRGTVPLLEASCASIDGRQGEQLVRVERLIKTNVTRLSCLINTILDAVEIENGSLRLVRKPLDLNRLVEEKIGLVAPTAEAKKLGWDIQLKPTLGEISADYERLGQAIYELLDNAVKFSPEGKTVRVATDGDGRTATVRIANAGEPIPCDQREEVFEMFHQNDNATTRKAGGCGLGLYLARNIAELHGGGLAIVDDAGDETVFCMSIPMLAEGDATPGAKA